MFRRQPSLFISVAVILSGCSATERNCIGHQSLYCDQGVLYWVDSCGTLEEPAEVCECGCNAGHSACQDCECDPRASTGCHEDGVWWFDSCGNPDEHIVDCPRGCADAKCLECDPDCAGRECGPDGCGGFCGECPAGLLCRTTTGTCVAECTPDCTGKECGDDGCGGSCGTCTDGKVCRNGVCVCLAGAFLGCHQDDVWWFDSCGNPDELELECPNGCTAGQCDDCVPLTCQQAQAECGEPPDGCGGALDCGGCQEPESCGGGGVPYACGCTPLSCEAVGAECGTVANGCGGDMDCGDCPAPTQCGVIEPNQCGCPPLPSGGTLEVDVPVANATIDVTLGGMPLTASNCGDYDEGELILVDPVTGDRSALGGVWDDNLDTLLTPYQVQIMPGVYDIYYSVTDDGPNWPSNTYVLLLEGVSFYDGLALTVDVPVAEATVDVTLDGQALTSANCGDYDEGQLVLVDALTGDRADLLGVWDDNLDTLLTPYQIQIIPGVYDVYYAVVDDGPNWPSNTYVLLREDVDFFDGLALSVDVPLANATIDVTLGGTPLTAANCNDYDEGELILVDAVTGDRSLLGGVWDDNLDMLLTPYSVQIIPGVYDIYYSVVDDGPNWPGNTNVLLREGVDFTDGLALTVDVPVAEATIEVTLGGQPLTAANCNDYDEGQLVLVDPLTGDRADLLGVWDDNLDTLLTPYQLQIIPGTYDVYYSVVDDGPNWPSNTYVLLLQGVSFTDGLALSIDVPVANATIDVTLGGEPLTSANCGDYDEGELILVDAVTGDRSPLAGVWDDNLDTLLTPYSVQIIPGVYDIYYSVVDDGPNWPSNTDVLLLEGVNFTDGLALMVNVPVAEVLIDVTLDSQPLTAANCGDYDEGSLILVDPVTGDRADLLGVWDDNLDALLTPYQVQIIPGVYEVYYSVVDDGPNWPGNAYVRLTCITILGE